MTLFKHLLFVAHLGAAVGRGFLTLGDAWAVLRQRHAVAAFWRDFNGVVGQFSGRRAFEEWRARRFDGPFESHADWLWWELQALLTIHDTILPLLWRVRITVGTREDSFLDWLEIVERRLHTLHNASLITAETSIGELERLVRGVSRDAFKSHRWLTLA